MTFCKPRRFVDDKWIKQGDTYKRGEYETIVSVNLSVDGLR